MPHPYLLLLTAMLLGSAACRAAPERRFAPPPTAIPTISPAQLCRQAAAAAEQAGRVPQDFLAAIARVESGRIDPATGSRGPWPWTVNAEGVGSFYPGKAEAIAAVQALQARGVQSIDVGCLQVNLMHHAGAFSSLDQAFDPLANATYAAAFLSRLFVQTGSWPLAAAAYHSQTPTIGAPYEKLVLAEWAVPADRPAARPHAAGPSAPSAAAASPAAPLSPPPAPGGVALTAIVPAGRMAPMVQRTEPPARVSGAAGRTLAAYRLLPVRMAWRAAPPG